MPDGHWGYGFPIGGVAAFRSRRRYHLPGESGTTSTAGMRLIRTDLTLSEVQPKLELLMTELFRRIRRSRLRGFVNLNRRDFREVMRKGAGWCIAKGYGWKRI